MNGHPRDQAKVSVHCRWALVRGTDGHVEMSRDIDNVAVHSRWPLTTGVAQGRYYCTYTPLKFSVIVAHRWRHLQYCLKICYWHSSTIAFDNTKTVSVELRCLLNKTFAVE